MQTDTKKKPAKTTEEKIKGQTAKLKKAAATLKAAADGKVPAKKTKVVAQGKVDEQTTDLTPPISSFAPVPDAKLSGPPYEFDKNMHCQNPKQRTANITECKPPIVVYLTYCEREGSFSASYRIDVPAFGENKEPKSHGPFFPFAGTGTLGYKSEEIALYEAGRQALEVMQSSPDKFPKGADKMLAVGVEKMRPAALKRAEAEMSIVGYDPAKADTYMLALREAMVVHPNGVEFKEDATEEQMSDIGHAIEHIDQKSNWIKGDWYNAMKKRFPKILDTLVTGDASRRTYMNLGSACAAFPLEERTFNVTFTHYQETLVKSAEGDKAVLTMTQRRKYLAAAESEGLSTLKLRARINEDLGKKKSTLTPASNTQPAGGSSTPESTEKPVTVDPGANPAPSDKATESEFDEPTEQPTEQTPPPSEAETINAKQGKVVEYIDFIESFLRAGHHKSTHLSASKQRDVKNMIAKLYELANK